MASHHFLGTGLVSGDLVAAARNSAGLLDNIERLVADCGLSVMARQAVAFPDEGQTLVWVLAESHLVLHYWASEGFATLDLHICDYQGSNAAKARALVSALRGFCFRPGTDSWHEHRLDRPMAVSAASRETLSVAAPR